MRWEEEYEEDIPSVGCIEIVDYIGDEDSEVTVKLNMPLSKWNLISRSKAWEEVSAMIEGGKVKKKRTKIGFQ